MVSTLLFRYDLTNGVHHLTPLQSTGAALKAMLDHMDRVLVDWPVGEKVRVVADFRAIDAPQATEAVPHLLVFLRRPTRNPLQQARLAFLYSRTTQGRILRGFLIIQRFLPQRASIRFFSEGEETRALEWLHTA